MGIIAATGVSAANGNPETAKKATKYTTFGIFPLIFDYFKN